jgi:hypothetical protein
MWEIEINFVWDPQNLALMIEPTLLQHNTSENLMFMELKN